MSETVRVCRAHSGTIDDDERNLALEYVARVLEHALRIASVDVRKILGDLRVPLDRIQASDPGRGRTCGLKSFGGASQNLPATV